MSFTQDPDSTTLFKAGESSDAWGAVFPATAHPTCIVHLIRNGLD
jgi:transposase-like protein